MHEPCTCFGDFDHDQMLIILTVFDAVVQGLGLRRGSVSADALMTALGFPNGQRNVCSGELREALAERIVRDLDP